MKWVKWDYLCTNCDANVEMTLKSDGLPHFSDCPKCEGFMMTLLSVKDVTVPDNKYEGGI